MELIEAEQRALFALIDRGLNLSAGKLAKLCRTHWQVVTMTIEPGSQAKLRELLNKDPADYYGAHITFPGGVFLILFSQPSSELIVKTFSSQYGSWFRLERGMDTSVIREFSNIMINAVGGVVADACDESFIMSAPLLARERKAALYDQALAGAKLQGDCLTLISYIQLATPKQGLDTTIISIFDPKRTDAILQAVGVGGAR